MAHRVTILRRMDLPTYPAPGQEEWLTAVTYQYGLMPPRTIYIKKEEWSQERERELIREDIERVRRGALETFEL